MLRFLLIIACLFSVIFAKVDINEASAEEFVKLKGIGQTKAEAIVKYREENGAFKTIDELANVKGIGKKTVENLRDELTIDGKSEKKTKQTKTKTTKADAAKAGDKASKPNRQSAKDKETADKDAE